MSRNRITFLVSLFLITVTGSLCAQTVKYVAYFPVPYLSHKTINAQTVYFAGRENGLAYKKPTALDKNTVDVKGTLTANSVHAKKDLELEDSTNTSPVITVDIVSGENVDWSMVNANGTFIVDKPSGQLGINSISSSSASGVKQLKADDSLTVKSINWKSGNNTDPTNNGFVKTATNGNNYSSATTSNDGFPTGTTRFCWVPLRIKGTYEYQYYLIAYNGTTCP